MKHLHKFKHIGGGCQILPTEQFDKDYPCDDDYECSCGAKLNLRMDYASHKVIPEIFEEVGVVGGMSEVKRKEIEMIEKEKPKEAC